MRGDCGETLNNPMIQSVILEKICIIFAESCEKRTDDSNSVVSGSFFTFTICYQFLVSTSAKISLWDE
jgi:hypothetical protein